MARVFTEFDSGWNTWGPACRAEKGPNNWASPQAHEHRTCLSGTRHSTGLILWRGNISPFLQMRKLGASHTHIKPGLNSGIHSWP